jgi:3-deoxy-7-phosphoheptulonate synthase
MRIFMKRGATLSEVGEVLARAEATGLSPHVVRDSGDVTVCVPESDPESSKRLFGALPGVEDVRPFSRNYKLVSREFRRRDSAVRVGDVAIGGDEVVLIAGPCAVESRDQMFRAARDLGCAGAHLLRGGAFKPRSSPYAFQGLKKEGLEILAAAREEYGLGIVTEVLSPEDVGMVAEYADMLQVGSRNMQNFSLLEALGEVDKPVLLKRGMMSTIEELLLSAEYIVAAGNPAVVLCERGIRTFERQTRNTLDVTAVAVAKDLSHLPVIVDPSHATGNRRYVGAAARAGTAAGADGLIIEVHPDPESALCDGAQSLTPAEFERLAANCTAIARALGRKVRDFDL